MTPVGARKKIVIADNDRTVLELMQIRLDVAGHQACVARSGAGALELMAQLSPDALIIDATLPEQGGFNVLDQLAQRGARLPCPTLVIGRRLSPKDLKRAHGLGVHDCMVKPFSGADGLDRLARMLKSPEEVVPLHIVEAQCLEQKELASLYPHEAAEHRRIMFARGSGMCLTWKNFRQFLVDLGPAPDTDHLATRLVVGDLTYGPGKVAWIHRDRQPSLIDRWAQIKVNPCAKIGAATKWTTVRGQPIEYNALAEHLGVPMDAMAMAIRNRPTADDLVQQASIAETLSQGDPSWLPADRRDAFMMGYRMWHMQVQQKFAAAATPAFLFMFSALPGMIQARDGLAELGLWDPRHGSAKAERDQHPLWRRFNDAAVRVEAARQEFAVYKQYSLMTEIDALWARVKLAEERYRRPSPPGAALAA